MKIKKFNEGSDPWDKPLFKSAQCRNIGELKSFISSLPDDMNIVVTYDQGNGPRESSLYIFYAYSTEQDHPGQDIFKISVN